MKKLKNNRHTTNKGITLIALVITIIVLLILAGVAINMAINSDGLFGKANEAAESWNTAVENERVAVQDLLNELGITAGGDDPVTLPEGWDSTKVSAVVEEGTRKAPIPEGFVASQITANEEGKGAENTISVGLVIYQGDDPVTGTAGSEAHTTAMTTRNQFVWIPVDNIDYMVMCKSNASGSVCDLELVDGVLQCTNTAHTSTATDLCGRVYATTSSNTTVDSKKIYAYSQTFDEAQWASQKWDTTSYREPDISVYDNNTTYLTLAGVSTTSELASQLTSDFTSMATSVAKYGGFYVSRYEAGENGASLKNQKVLVAGTTTVTGYDTNTFVDGNMWHGMYNALRSSTALGETVVSSHMIWGSQYDMIIKYLGENSLNEPQVGHPDRQLGTQELTGETITDIMSNIYDLEGNNFEWTAQTRSSNHRPDRGGSFSEGNRSAFYPASIHWYGINPNSTGCCYGSRTTLYL